MTKPTVCQPSRLARVPVRRQGLSVSTLGFQLFQSPGMQTLHPNPYCALAPLPLLLFPAPCHSPMHQCRVPSSDARAPTCQLSQSPSTNTLWALGARSEKVTVGAMTR